MANRVLKILLTCGKLLLAWTILLGSFALFVVPHIGQELFTGFWAFVWRVATKRDMTRRLDRQMKDALSRSQYRQTVEQLTAPDAHARSSRAMEGSPPDRATAARR